MNSKDAPRLTDVYLFANGNVMAFDQYGQQMPDYQGPRVDVWDRIEAAFARDPSIVIKGLSKALQWEDIHSTNKAE